MSLSRTSLRYRIGRFAYENPTSSGHAFIGLFFIILSLIALFAGSFAVAFMAIGPLHAVLPGIIPDQLSDPVPALLQVLPATLLIWALMIYWFVSS